MLSPLNQRKTQIPLTPEPVVHNTPSEHQTPRQLLEPLHHRNNSEKIPQGEKNFVTYLRKSYQKPIKI